MDFYAKSHEASDVVFLAGAMITVSANVVGDPFDMEMPIDMYPTTNVLWVVIVAGL